MPKTQFEENNSLLMSKNPKYSCRNTHKNECLKSYVFDCVERRHERKKTPNEFTAYVFCICDQIHYFHTPHLNLSH